MNEIDREEIRRIVEEVLDEREARDEPVGIARVPRAVAARRAAGEHEHEDGAGEDVHGREEEQEHEGHEHMPFFPLFVREEDGTVAELDPSEVPRFACDEPGCEDPTHDHSAHPEHDHDRGHAHGHDHERSEEGAAGKRRRRTSGGKQREKSE